MNTVRHDVWFKLFASGCMACLLICTGLTQAAESICESVQLSGEVYLTPFLSVFSIYNELPIRHNGLMVFATEHVEGDVTTYIYYQIIANGQDRWCIGPALGGDRPYAYTRTAADHPADSSTAWRIRKDDTGAYFSANIAVNCTEATTISTTTDAPTGLDSGGIAGIVLGVLVLAGIGVGLFLLLKFKKIPCLIRTREILPTALESVVPEPTEEGSTTGHADSGIIPNSTSIESNTTPTISSSTASSVAAPYRDSSHTPKSSKSASGVSTVSTTASLSVIAAESEKGKQNTVSDKTSPIERAPTTAFDRPSSPNGQQGEADEPLSPARSPPIYVHSPPDYREIFPSMTSPEEKF